jgi:hypothetical protein
LVQHTKTGRNIPQRGKIYQMAMKYTNIFHCKTLENLPKLGLLFSKYTYHLATLVQRLLFYQ